jgi:uncharacterized Zn finger protein (UPF0148 family)
MGRLDNLSCPICGREIERGYIFSTREIAWTEDGKSRLIPSLYPHETLVHSLGLKVEKATAYRCDQCRIVLFQYDDSL